MVLKKISFAVLAIASSQALAQLSTLTPNSKQLNVSKFYVRDSITGHIENYQVVGFYEPAVGGTKARVSLMPRIYVSGVTYIAKNGTTILNPADADESKLSRIRVSLRYNGDLPNERQRLSVLGQIGGNPLDGAAGDPIVYSFKGMVTPGGSVLETFDFASQAGIKASLKKITDRVANEKQLSSKWLSDVQASVVSVQGIRLTLEIDGDATDERYVPASLISSGSLPDLFATNVSEYQLNALREGRFKVRVDYGFLDTNSGAINAEFKFEKAMNQMIEESRSIVTSSSKNGVAFLGFGSRKSKLSQSMREQSKEKITQDEFAQTRIEMRDAGPELIDMFEKTFFPDISRAKAVSEHIAAGEEAKKAGNEILAKAHFGYADALSKNELDLKPDIDGALKSLSSKDYAGFIAKGVRIQSSKDSIATQYSRVLSFEVKEASDVKWTATRSVSTQRAVTQFIEPDLTKVLADLGLCDGFGGTVGDVLGVSKTFYVTCVITNGPLARAGIVPGESIATLNGKTILNGADWLNALDDVAPGETVKIARHVLQLKSGNWIWTKQNVNVKAARGMPK